MFNNYKNNRLFDHNELKNGKKKFSPELGQQS